MKKLLIMVLTLTLFAACSEDPVSDIPSPGDPDTGMPIEFGSGIRVGVTRLETDATGFSTGDRIRVAGYRQASAPQQYGVPFLGDEFVLSGGTNRFSTESEQGYWTLYSPYCFYAWYPSSIGFPAGDTQTTVSLPAVTSPCQGGLPGEVLWAKVENFRYNGNTTALPTLTFERKLARIRFCVQYAANYAADPSLKLEQISFTAANQAATMNMFTGEITLKANDVTYTSAIGSEELTEKEAAPAKDAAGYNALGFSPMLYATATTGGATIKDCKVTLSGRERELAGFSGWPLQAGKVTYILLTVKDPEHILFSFSVMDWLEGGTSGVTTPSDTGDPAFDPGNWGNGGSGGSTTPDDYDRPQFDPKDWMNGGNTGTTSPNDTGDPTFDPGNWTNGGSGGSTTPDDYDRPQFTPHDWTTGGSTNTTSPNDTGDPTFDPGNWTNGGSNSSSTTDDYDRPQLTPKDWVGGGSTSTTTPGDTGTPAFDPGNWTNGGSVSNTVGTE